MRILLSAYACEPNRGSEPGIGWHWSLTLQQKGHTVTVLTRANNRDVIEDWVRRNGDIKAPDFVYYDLPEFFLRLKRVGLLPVQLYYCLWQIGVLASARREATARPFDIVWHLTFGVLRQPSLLWQLDLPFIVGPVGGGERAPFRMRKDYSISGHLKDVARDVLNLLSRLDPILRRGLTRSLIVFARTSQSANLLPAGTSASVHHEVGIEPGLISDASGETLGAGNFLFVGRMVYFKGVSLIIRAFAEYRALGGTRRLTLIGSGPEESRCRRLAAALGVADRIDWVTWVEQSRLWSFYREHGVFVFPSLHDSGGSVVIEAMSQGLPVICFDLGGPAQIVTAESGVVISTEGRDAYKAAREFGRQMKALEDDPARLARLVVGALARAREFTWSARIDGAMRKIEHALARRKGHEQDVGSDGHAVR